MKSQKISSKYSIPRFFKVHNILQKDERKRNYKVLQKHCCPCEDLLLSTWKPEQWALLKLQTYFMTVFHRNLQRPLVWVYSPAKRGWGWGTGEGWTKISGSKPHSTELLGSATVPHRCQDKRLHTIFKQKEQFYCFMFALVFHVS